MTEPQHLHKTVVILAGYRHEMDDMLEKGNTGLRSRITGRIEFPDWSAEDCVDMIKAKAASDGISLGAGASEALGRGLAGIRARNGWANARDGHNVLRRLYSERAQRLGALRGGGGGGAPEESEAAPTYTQGDVAKALERLGAQRPALADGGGRKNGGVAPPREHTPLTPPGSPSPSQSPAPPHRELSGTTTISKRELHRLLQLAKRAAAPSSTSSARTLVA